MISIYPPLITKRNSEIGERKPGSLDLKIRMQLHGGAELFGNVIVPYSELTSKYHIGA